MIEALEEDADLTPSDVHAARSIEFPNRRPQPLTGGLEFSEMPCFQNLTRTDWQPRKFLKGLDFADPKTFFLAFLTAFLTKLSGKCHGNVFDFGRLDCFGLMGEGGFVNFGLGQWKDVGSSFAVSLPS